MVNKRINQSIVDWLAAQLMTVATEAQPTTSSSGESTTWQNDVPTTSEHTEHLLKLFIIYEKGGQMSFEEKFGGFDDSENTVGLLIVSLPIHFPIYCGIPIIRVFREYFFGSLRDL